MGESGREVQSYDERREALDARMQGDLDSGEVVYDRSSVLSPDYTKVEPCDGGWVYPEADPDLESRYDRSAVALSIPSMGSLVRAYDGNDASGIHGTCRDIAPFTTWRYVEDGLLDSAETYSCAEGGEFHYVTIGKVAGKEVLVDMGYFLPLRNAIEVHPEGAVSTPGQWQEAQIKKDGELIDVLCNATRKGDVVILDVRAKDIETHRYLKHFKFKIVDDERDVETAKGWVGVTGSAYRMDEHGNKNSLTAEEIDAGRLMTQLFADVHRIAQRNKDNVTITLREAGIE